MKGLDEEGWGNFKHAGRHTGEELVIWVKTESQLLLLLSWNVAPFKMQNAGSNLSKACEMSFSFKEFLFDHIDDKS